LDKKLTSKINKWVIGLLIAGMVLQAPNAYAQSSVPDKPTYIVQTGDTLSSIALRFAVSLVDLEDANGITDPNNVSVGLPLVIPGLDGVHGFLTTDKVALGETLTGLSRVYQVPVDTLVTLNHITSPIELYAGANLVIPKPSQDSTNAPSQTLASGQSLLELAVLSNSNPWTLKEANGLTSTWDAIPGEVLALPAQSKALGGSSPISPMIQKIDISPLPVVQGKTAVIKITTTAPMTLGGSLAGYALHFFSTAPNEYVSLQGLNAIAAPGVWPLTLNGKTDDGGSFNFGQMILMKSGNYPQDPPLQVDPITLDPAVTKPEDEQVASIVAPTTPDKLWTEAFRLPVDQPICIKSWFGDRRSYNGGPFIYYHTGLDYGVCANLNIYAAAPGVVVFTGPLTVRGNATIINHGWGVYTAYYHQKQFLVKVGDVVKGGQQIGVIGATGRVNGPHLHFEIWVNGVQVDPEDWQAKAYP
jgi:murein DD-endopeptidase MepM/ murein hydrolase activator NlpD